jgi:hypothetical protein
LIIVLVYSSQEGLSENRQPSIWFDLECPNKRETLVQLLEIAKVKRLTNFSLIFILTFNLYRIILK